MRPSLDKCHLQPLPIIAALLLSSITWADETLEPGWIELPSGDRLEVEIAATQQLRERGLMFRTTLAENSGMLFVYPQAEQQAMWMKNTLIALDVIFIDEDGKIVSILRNLTPCQKMPCPTYQSKGKARYMLEVAAGVSDKLNLNPDQELLIDYRHP